MKLSFDFYSRDTQTVARELLGKVFICRGKELVITETEAYLGPEDLASHARFGPTQRTRIMWDRGGLLYVYLIYGVYEMTNIVTGRENEPGAVLLRSGWDPKTGQEVKGPGLFSRYLGITRKDKGVDLVQSPTLFVDDRGNRPQKILSSPRVGISYADTWVYKPFRYVIQK